MSEQASEKPKAQLDAEFSELYRAHLRDVYSYAYYRVGDHHDAEDLTEQTFLQAYRHFERAQRESDGRPLRYPTVESCSPALASAVTERIWACVSLQWDWLGGEQRARPAQLDEVPRREISRAA